MKLITLMKNLTKGLYSMAGVCVLLSFFALSMRTEKIVTEEDKNEAQKAFSYINELRQNPSNYSKIIGVNLNSVKARPTLIWNDTLARVATERAMDMAKRNYFGHVNPDGIAVNYLINKAGYTLREDWLAKKSNNFFESIQAGADDGIGAVNYLIVDQGIPNLGHRKHLLGMDEWNSKLRDIGIGFVRAKGSEYTSYMVVIIAMHNMEPKVIIKRRR